MKYIFLLFFCQAFLKEAQIDPAKVKQELEGFEKQLTIKLEGQNMSQLKQSLKNLIAKHNEIMKNFEKKHQKKRLIPKKNMKRVKQTLDLFNNVIDRVKALIKKKMMKKKVQRRKLTLNNVLRAIQNEPKEDKKLFGDMLLKMGIPKMKQVIRKFRNLEGNPADLLNFNFLQPLAFFYMMVQSYRFFQYQELMSSEIESYKEERRKLGSMNLTFENDNRKLREAALAMQSTNKKIHVIYQVLKDNLNNKIKVVYKLEV